jgi:hypothetical protein
LLDSVDLARQWRRGLTNGHELPGIEEEDLADLGGMEGNVDAVTDRL